MWIGWHCQLLERVRRVLRNVRRRYECFVPGELTHIESVMYDTLRRLLEKLSGTQTMQSYRWVTPTGHCPQRGRTQAVGDEAAVFSE